MKQEVGRRLVAARKRLRNLGVERNTKTLQLAYLTDLAPRFQRLVSLSLDAKYGSDEAFDYQTSLRLATAVTARSTKFNGDMARCRQEFTFTSLDKSSSAEITESYLTVDDPTMALVSLDVRDQDSVDDLWDILHAQESVTASNGKEIKTRLREVYETSRGFELGTFDSSILSTTMKKQSCKWVSISLGDVIVLAHNFITTALASICHDSHVK